jgi:hypothetical protein
MKWTQRVSLVASAVVVSAVAGLGYAAGASAAATLPIGMAVGTASWTMTYASAPPSAGPFELDGIFVVGGSTYVGKVSTNRADPANIPGDFQYDLTIASATPGALKGSCRATDLSSDPLYLLTLPFGFVCHVSIDGGPVGQLTFKTIGTLASESGGIRDHVDTYNGVVVPMVP